MTTIQEAVDWITALHNFHHGFDHFQRFMASQGDPQDQLRTIHVAGTNGKGSTVSYLANVLREAGYTVGTFTAESGRPSGPDPDSGALDRRRHVCPLCRYLPGFTGTMGSGDV